MILKRYYSLRELQNLQWAPDRKGILCQVKIENKTVLIRRVYVLDNFTCQKCGRQATIFELSSNDKSLMPYIFNVHAGNLIPLTRDHIIPKSVLNPRLRLELRMENKQTLCAHCNSKKSNILELDLGLTFKNDNFKHIRKMINIHLNAQILLGILQKYRAKNTP